MRIELHVFGSLTGYTTLHATPGLSLQDRRLLEGGAYRFGQPDEDYLQTLAHAPACFTRLLPLGRRGLTRVTAGRPDDNGRPTLRMVTAVISQHDWDDVLGGDIGLLMNDAAVWQPASFDAAITRDLPLPNRQLSPAAAATVLAVLSELEHGREKPVVVAESAVDFDVIRGLEMLAPLAIRPRFTTAWRSLSRKLDATVNAITDGNGSAGLPTAVSQQPLSAYARRLADSGVSDGDLTTPLPRTYTQFGDLSVAPAAVRGPHYVPPPMPARRIPVHYIALPVVVVVLVCLILAGAATAWFVRRQSGGLIGGPPATSPSTTFSSNPSLVTAPPIPSPPVAVSPATTNTTLTVSIGPPTSALPASRPADPIATAVTRPSTTQASIASATPTPPTVATALSATRPAPTSLPTTLPKVDPATTTIAGPLPADADEQKKMAELARRYEQEAAKKKPVTRPSHSSKSEKPAVTRPATSRPAAKPGNTHNKRSR